MYTKHMLRTQMREVITGLSQEEKECQSQLVCAGLITLIAEQNPSTIVLYSALLDEVDITPVIQTCLEQNKHVLLPKVVDSVSMELYSVASLEELVICSFGIKEPIEKNVLYKNAAIDMIVVPGRAFDLEGGRLGRGKGYYDRLLERYPEVLKIGVCFDIQIIDEVPVEEWDVKMDKIISGTSCF